MKETAAQTIAAQKKLIARLRSQVGANCTNENAPKFQYARDSITAQIAHDDELRHLESMPYIPKGRETVLAISDLHAPFQHPDAFDFLDAIAQKYNPTRIVGLGDGLDFHAVSQYAKHMKAMSAADELELGVMELQPLFKMFPRLDECYSNHTMRPFRTAAAIGLPERVLRTVKEFTGAPDGWKWHDFVKIDDWRYEHGEAFGGKHVTLNYAEGSGINVAFGHHHSAAGVQWAVRREDTVAGLACSCLIDPVRYAFAYGKNCARRPVLGTGVVVKNIPVYIPLLTDKRGRWIRKLAF